MNATTINTLVGIVGIVVGIIGAVVGIIGWNSLAAATTISNKAKASKGAMINQGNTYNYGVSEDTVRLITKDMTKEEMCRLIVRLIPINTDNEDCVANKLAKGTLNADMFEIALNELPTIYYGEKEPPSAKDGNIWYKCAKHD